LANLIVRVPIVYSYVLTVALLPLSLSVVRQQGEMLYRQYFSALLHKTVQVVHMFFSSSATTVYSVKEGARKDTHTMVVVEAAHISAAVNVANFVIGQTVNEKTDSAMLRRIQEQAKNNSVLGAPTHETLIADSPMVEGLHQTAQKGVNAGDNACADGIAYVFFERRSQGKSSAARFFCQKSCRKSDCRSLLISASTGGDTYFQRVAADLGVTFTSNWARCLVSAMTKSPKEKNNPFLFLDEFNEGTKRDLRDLNLFMRACQNLGFYLIVITSKKKIADDVMELNAFGKMRPLRFIHNGPTTNIRGQPGYEENKTADWKEIDWTFNQLKNLVVKAMGEFGDYGFIVAGMTPTDALIVARRLKNQREEQEGGVVAVNSDLSGGASFQVPGQFCGCRVM
jgi:hypothetical protein